MLEKSSRSHGDRDAGDAGCLIHSYRFPNTFACRKSAAVIQGSPQKVLGGLMLMVMIFKRNTLKIVRAFVLYRSARDGLITDLRVLSNE